MSETGGIIVRRASEEDLDTICEMIRLVVPKMNNLGNYQWNDTYPLRTDFSRDLDANQLWVATINSAVAGVIAICNEQPEEYAGIDWDVSVNALVPHRMAVHPMFNGRGVAKVLLQFAEEFAVAQGIKIVRVDTCTKNPATMSLFPKLGYLEKGEIILTGKPADHRFMCFEKILST
jgi:GNAT superfamily N-acetyltransferase